MEKTDFNFVIEGASFNALVVLKHVTPESFISWANKQYAARDVWALYPHVAGDRRTKILTAVWNKAKSIEPVKLPDPPKEKDKK